MTEHQPAATSTGAYQEIRYGGFWLRVAAFLIDWIIVALGIGLILAATSGPGMVVGWVIPWVYEALLLSSERQATLGKMAVGLIVTDDQGERLTFGRATGRHFAKYLSAFFFGIGFALAAFTAKRQALHDLIVSTIVVFETRG